MPRKHNKSASRGTNAETVAANTGRTSLGRQGARSETWSASQMKVKAENTGSVTENPKGSPGVPDHY